MAVDGRVYAQSCKGELVCLEAASGTRLWAVNYTRDFGAVFIGEKGNAPGATRHGNNGSPWVSDGVVYASAGSTNGAAMVALDAKTGRERWKTPRGLSRISHGAPCIWDHDGHPQVVSEAGDVVQGFDLKNGERLWTSEVIGEGKVPSAVIGEGMVFTSGGWGGKETIKAFRLGGRGDLKESNLVWEQKKGMPKLSSMVFVKPHLFAITDGGVATCLRGDSGQIVWQERVGGNFAASPVAAAGRIYCVGDSGETTVLAAGPEFKVLARNPLEEKVQASPAISQGQIFIRTEHHLYCIGGK